MPFLSKNKSLFYRSFGGEIFSILWHKCFHFYSELKVDGVSLEAEKFQQIVPISWHKCFHIYFEIKNYEVSQEVKHF